MLENYSNIKIWRYNKKMAYGEPHLQDFSTCSKWQPTYSLCSRHTKECHKTTSHITIMPFKPTFHASLYHTHHAFLESTTNLFLFIYFLWKTNTTMLPPSYLSAILTTMCMEFPLVEWGYMVVRETGLGGWGDEMKPCT